MDMAKSEKSRNGRRLSIIQQVPACSSLPTDTAQLPPPREAFLTKAKKPKNLSSYRRLLSALALWGVPFAWIVMSLPPFAPYRAGERSRTTLAVALQALKAYSEEHSQLPRDLNALRSYAVAEQQDFGTYDAWGQRLEYIRLDDQRFLLRSFGSDGVQNRLDTAPDPGHLDWGQHTNMGPTYEYPSLAIPELYPAVLLEGNESPTRNWLARLYADRANGKRHLLVRHRVQADLFMVASHDGVEEFLWLPDGHRLVFTASGSTRYRDGVYVWNLVDNTLVNLFDSSGTPIPISPAAGGTKLWLSLAGLTAAGPTVHVYAMLRHDGPLDPRLFFDRSRLHSIIIPGRKGETMANLLDFSAPGAPDQTHIPPHARLADLQAGVGNLNNALPIQQRWLRLKVRGDLEGTLLAWHDFSTQEPNSILYPYSLWMLSILYGEGYKLLIETHPRDADVLRAYGTEIARALINHRLAPSYLQSLALFTYETLMEAQSPPYGIAQLNTQH